MCCLWLKLDITLIYCTTLFFTMHYHICRNNSQAFSMCCTHKTMHFTKLSHLKESLCTEHKLLIDRTICGFEILTGIPCTNCFSQQTYARMKLLFLHLGVVSTSLCTYSIFHCTFNNAFINIVSKYDHSLWNTVLALELNVGIGIS